MDSHYSLRWNNYASQLTNAFGSLLINEDLVDVTLSCEGKKIKAHKMLLSACSPYFRGIFKENPCQHPVIVFRNVHFTDLKAIVEFIYCGEVSVLQEQLESFLQTAGTLEVKGLTDKENESEAEETSGANLVDEDNMQTVMQTQANAAKKHDSRPPTASGRNSPVAKKRKPNVTKPLDPPSEVTPVIKEELEEAADEKDVEPEVSEPPVGDGVSMTPMVSFQDSDSNTSKNITDDPEEPSSTEHIEEKTEPIEVDPPVKDEGEKLPSTSPDVEIVESDNSVPLKKRKNLKEKDAIVDEIPAKSAKKTEVKSPPGKKATGKVQIPKGLVVTSVKAASQVENLFDFPTQEPQDESVALRSEEATTPVHEEPMPCSQDTLYANVPPEQNSEAEPEIAEEAPVLQETEPEEPEPDEEETKFDYFGCEICSSEAKPVDLERITFTHKCPICPCCCFCAHLLKEHMRVIHGWFNVQRRFTHY